MLLVAFDAHAGIPCSHHRQTELWSLQSAYPTGAGMYRLKSKQLTVNKVSKFMKVHINVTLTLTWYRIWTRAPPLVKGVLNKMTTKKKDCSWKENYSSGDFTVN